jgi:enamine deaminase RidA (YjgF/YER057c/UK114 family)
MTITRIAKTERLSRVVVHEKVAYFSGLTADDRSQDTVGQTEQILAKADAFLEKIGSNRSLLLSATIWLRDIEPPRVNITGSPDSTCSPQSSSTGTPSISVMQSQSDGMKDFLCRPNFWRISLRWVGHTYY